MIDKVLDILGDNLSSEWINNLSVGDTFIFGDCLVNVIVEDNVIFIDSASKDNKKFPKRALAMIMDIVKNNDYVVVSTIREKEISRKATKLGMVYSKHIEAFIKVI